MAKSEIEITNLEELEKLLDLASTQIKQLHHTLDEINQFKVKLKS
ncbi:MAG: hypothetical protein ABF743_14400 [Schleiferilactobacillus perolens]|jgi:hypothetical protein